MTTPRRSKPGDDTAASLALVEADMGVAPVTDLMLRRGRPGSAYSG